MGSGVVDLAQEFEVGWVTALERIQEEADATGGAIAGVVAAWATGGINPAWRVSRRPRSRRTSHAAAENFARAMGWIGLGNFASAAAAKASAAGHLKAAALWGAAARRGFEHGR